MSARDPEAILAELGHDLRAAWARPPRRALLARWPRGPRLVLALLALVPTALATRDAIWAPDPAPLPVAARPPGSVTPQRTGAQVYVAAGVERGVAWRLTASACDYGRVRAVGVFLTVPGGGGGARCDVASRRPGVGVSPSVLARRLVQTYFDPVSGRTWAFGALPAAARTVDVTSVGARRASRRPPPIPTRWPRAACPPGCACSSRSSTARTTSRSSPLATPRAPRCSSVARAAAPRRPQGGTP